MCLTSVFGMVASLSAAGGRFSEGAASAAVDEGRRPYGRGHSSGTAIGNRWTHIHPFHREKTSTFSGGGLCWHYLFSRSVTRQLSSAHVCLTSVFGLGSDGSAASGGRSDLSEWQRSARSKLASTSAASAGHRNSKTDSVTAVAFPQKSKSNKGS